VPNFILTENQTLRKCILSAFTFYLQNRKEKTIFALKEEFKEHKDIWSANLEG